MILHVTSAMHPNWAFFVCVPLLEVVTRSGCYPIRRPQPPVDSLRYLKMFCPKTFEKHSLTENNVWPQRNKAF